MFLADTLIFCSPVVALSSLLGRLTPVPTRVLYVGVYLTAHLISSVWFPNTLPLRYFYAPALAFLAPLRGPLGGTFGTFIAFALLAPSYFFPPFGAGHSIWFFILVILAAFWIRFFAVTLTPIAAIRVFLVLFILQFLFFPSSGLSLFLILSGALGVELLRRLPSEYLVDTFQWVLLVALTLSTYRY